MRYLTLHYGMSRYATRLHGTPHHDMLIYVLIYRMEQAVTGYAAHNDTGISVNETRVAEIKNNVKLTNSERQSNR